MSIWVGTGVAVYFNRFRSADCFSFFIIKQNLKILCCARRLLFALHNYVLLQLFTVQFYTYNRVRLLFTVYNQQYQYPLFISLRLFSLSLFLSHEHTHIHTIWWITLFLTRGNRTHTHTHVYAHIYLKRSFVW